MTTKDPAALLNRLLVEPGESSWLEFKQNNNDHQMIGEWASACANAAILSGKERAFLVFGIENKTKRKVGTSVRLENMKVGGENFTNWLCRLIEPRLMMEFLDFDSEGMNFSILTIEPTYDRPVRFSGTEYFRIGENTKKLSEFPDHERSLWLATGRRKFESALAATHQTAAEVLLKLDADSYYTLARQPRPDSAAEVIRHFCSIGFLVNDMEGGYDITNLGAILFAKDITQFPSISTKSIRVIKYVGTDKQKSEREQEGKLGYAIGFAGLLRFVARNLPSEEQYKNGIRAMIPMYPEIAIREVIANALIHQDFTVSGIGPVIEIYSDRIEVTNPGNSLIEVDRIIDERRSRNEKLASTMRGLGLCEERGGGIDKALIEIELKNLPAPEFVTSEHSMRVILFGPKPFSDLSKNEKLRACFFHCVLRWIKKDYMSNTSLRGRFSLPDEEYQAVSAIISESVKKKRIIPAEPGQGNRYAKYIPYWAR